MPSFSDRRGLPSCRTEEYCRDRCRGRRPGNASTCRARLRGWIARVADRSPIWGDLDLGAFCRVTGYSREHATRELSSIRREGEFAFETKLRTKGSTKAKKWGVIVARPDKLAYDKCSLFYDRNGRRLHNYTTLGEGGEKITPTVVRSTAAVRRRRGRPRKATATVTPPAPRRDEQASQNPSVAPLPEVCENPRVCDNSILEEGSFGTQQQNQYGAERGIAQRRGSESIGMRHRAPPALRRKAFAMLDALESGHWDNCKVHFSHRTAFCFALRALHDGHAEGRIVSCYTDALHFCHGLAVDQAASTGRITFFNLSSTVLRAWRLLSKDGLSRTERVAQWYRANRSEERVEAPTAIDTDELAQVRAAIAATFPR